MFGQQRLMLGWTESHLSSAKRRSRLHTVLSAAAFLGILAVNPEAGGSTLAVVCERSLGPDYTANKVFSSSQPIFSADLKRLAFYKQRDRLQLSNLVGASTEKGQRWQLVIDGVPTEEFDWVSEPVFSPDGAHVAYVARTENYAHIMYGGLVFDNPGKSWLIYDGARISENLDVATFQFSPDGQQLVYVAAETPGQSYLYRDGERLWDHTVSGHQPVFNERGDKLAFVRREAEGLSVVVAEEIDGSLQILSQSATHEGIYGPRFVPPGDKVAYVAVDAGRSRVVVGDAEGPDYAHIASSPVVPVFTADGEHFAYVANYDDMTQVVVVDHKELTRARDISEFTMSMDAPVVAYYAERDDRRAAERNGTQLHEPVPWRWAHGPQRRGIALSATGERIAFIQPVDKQRVAVNVDGRLSRHWEGVYRIRFSDDGEHLLYQAQEKRRTALVLDGVEIDSVPKEYVRYLADFIPGSADVVAWRPDDTNKTWTVTFNGMPTPASFDEPGVYPGTIKADRFSVVRATGVRDGNYQMVMLAREGEAVAPDCL